MRHLLTLTLVLTGCGTVVLDVEGLSEPDDGIVVSSLVLVPGGDFTMGCDPASDSQCDADEYPTHPVTLSSFYIDRYETTQATYEKCVADGGCSEPGMEPVTCNWDPVQNADMPVVCVTFAQAQAYCAWRGLRLPREAEWERAARGTTMSLYPWGDSLPDCTRANSSECGEELMEAGALPDGATPDGLLDMAGNAGEWVSDWYNADYYGWSGARDPAGPTTGDYRVIRGGMMTLEARYLRSSNRSADDPTLFRFSVGFRCAVEAE